MLKRFLTSIVIMAITIGFFALRFVSPYIFDVFVLAMAVMSTYEVCKAYNDSNRKNDWIVVMAYPILFFVLGFLTIFFKLSILFFLAMIFALVVLLFVVCICINKFSKSKINKEMVEVGYKKSYKSYVMHKSILDLFLMIYPTILIGGLSVINNIANFVAIPSDYAQIAGMFVLVMTFVTTIATDTFAYLIGRGIGGKKLCPTISPNKTISGAIGGILFSVLFSICLFLVFGIMSSYRAMFSNCNISIWTCLVYGIVASIISQLGDIFASLIKRKNGIKDYGNIFPGHGGVLDRIDGLCFNAFLTAILALIVFAI